MKRGDGEGVTTELFERRGSRLRLGRPQPRFRVKRLALEVRYFDDVMVDDPNAACMCGSMEG